MDTNAITNAYTAQATAESASASKAKNEARRAEGSGQPAVKREGAEILQPAAQEIFQYGFYPGQLG